MLALPRGGELTAGRLGLKGFDIKSLATLYCPLRLTIKQHDLEPAKAGVVRNRCQPILSIHCDARHGAKGVKSQAGNAFGWGAAAVMQLPHKRLVKNRPETVHSGQALVRIGRN